MEEKGAKYGGSLNFNSNMGVIRSISIQLPHCNFMGSHVHCYFNVPLGQYSQASWQVRPSYIHFFSFSFFGNGIWWIIVDYFGFRDVPDMSWLEISEESTIEMVNGIREWIEEGIRWMFRVSAERDWFVFVRTVVGLLLLSYVGTSSDLLTLLYIGNLLRKSEIYIRVCV